MKKQTDSLKLITYLNYKDILIILGSWYFMALVILISKQFSLKHLMLTSLFHFLFIISGRFIYFALLIFYLTNLYPVEFSQLGLIFSHKIDQIKKSFSRIIVLYVVSLLLINIPLSFNAEKPITALFMVTGPESFIASLFPFSLLFISCIFISLSEQFILNVIVFELLNYTYFNYLISLIITALFYSILITTFVPGRMLVNFLAALISIIIYSKHNSIISSSLFMAGYYSIYIGYIYGWGFIKF